MGKQHTEPSPGEYATRNSIDAGEPPSGPNRQIFAQAQHAGATADAAHDKKKAQNALHEDLRGDRPKGAGAGYIKPVDK